MLKKAIRYILLKNTAMKTISLLTFLIQILGFNSICQINNTRVLDRNNVSCIIGDEGYLFNNSTNGTAAYEVPKNSGLNTIYHASFWFAAKNSNGILHLSGSAPQGYLIENDLHSGPISSNSSYNSQNYINQYIESIWQVTRQEILNHISSYSSVGYTVPSSISTWPGNGNTILGVAADLAPYIDLNNNGIYDPANGDYPDIRGDEAVYVIMNDKSYSPDQNALGIEVHLMAYQYTSGNYLNNTTFLNLQVYNRSNTNYNNFRQSLYLDFDIGNYSDDYIGCFPEKHIVFGYNGDDNDESDGGQQGYGSNPPCQGAAILSHDLFSAGYFTGSSQYPYGDYALTDDAMWNLMNAHWTDGTYWLHGGQGYAGSAGVSNNISNFLFDGNPNDPDGWHEANVNNPAGDRRSIMTIAESSFPAGSKICSDYAFIYDRTSTRLQNVQNVINIAGSLRTLYNSPSFFPCQSASFSDINENELPDLLIYPNPFHDFITIINAVGVKFLIYDGNGKMLKTVVSTSEKEIVDLSDLSSGIYIIHSEDPTQFKPMRIIK